MSKKLELLAEKRTRLAEIRTELAYRRTMSADLRTASTMILFGIAFIGFSKVIWDFFFTAGTIVIFVGVIYLVSALSVLWKHSRLIKSLKKILIK